MGHVLDANTKLRHEQCPRCKSLGKDTSKDNLAIYGDGHKWCYACGYHKPATLEARVARLGTITTTPATNKAPKTLQLPDGTSLIFPPKVLQRLNAWKITDQLIRKHSLMWCEPKGKLILPVYDEFGQLLMYQERSWDIAVPKYLTFGQPSDILHILRPEGNEDNTIIILCEDLISAIRISEYKNAMPLWGSDIPLKTIQRLASRFYVVGVWLDPDMKLKALKDVLRISQYVPAFFIDSNLDPKFYPLDRIKEHIDISSYSMLYKDQVVGKINDEHIGG